MTTKWNALALGLAATVIFSAGEVQAQPGPFTQPAEVHVTRDADFFIFSSNLFLDPMFVCPFRLPGPGEDGPLAIQTNAEHDGTFPSIGDFGEIQPDGSLLVNRAELLETLDSMGATFALFCTECGTNTGAFGAQALRARIGVLEDGESVTLHTIYFIFEDCTGEVP